MKDDSPGKILPLTDWKLQIPGPVEIKDLENYSSEYFYLVNNQLVLSIDAAEEKGFTKNAVTHRVELRHLFNWGIDSTVELFARLKVESKLTPDYITVVQIHGITEDQQQAPPLLRLVLRNNFLYGAIKYESSGKQTENQLLVPDKIVDEFSCQVNIENRKLMILVNGEKRTERDISFWKFRNYLKAGGYVHANEGSVKVYFKELTAVVK